MEKPASQRFVDDNKRRNFNAVLGISGFSFFTLIQNETNDCFQNLSSIAICTNLSYKVILLSNYLSMKAIISESKFPMHRSSFDENTM